MADGYSLKEMVSEIRAENRLALETQSRIVSSLENIDKHLANLNSKVAAHEKQLSSLESFQTKAMLIWSFVVFIVVTVANKIIANI